MQCRLSCTILHSRLESEVLVEASLNVGDGGVPVHPSPGKVNLVHLPASNSMRVVVDGLV